VPFDAQMRAKLVQKDGRDFHQLDGYASITDRAYEMWDFFGPYEEEVAGGAFDATLAAKPDVAFLVNHKGITMARTTNGSLELGTDALGLRSSAWLNPERQDVRDLVSAIDDQLITEMSFAFMITDASWNEDYTKYSITEVDLNRGDVSAVNYGANPYTSIAARSREVMADIDHLPAGAAQAALGRLQRRIELAPTRILAPEPEPKPSGRSTRSVDAWLATIPEVRIAAAPGVVPRTRAVSVAAQDQFRRELRRLAVTMQQRALSPAETSTLQALLVQLAAADAVFDPICEAFCDVDDALDAAQTSLASMLGLPDPDPDEVDEGMDPTGPMA
jgi:hypothetical protein